MPPADPQTRNERYDETGECNAPRAGRKAVCIFHAGAAPAVIENIYMLFMGHTCFKNQTRHRAIPRRFSPRALSPRPPFARKPLLFRLLSFDCLPFSVSPFPAERRISSQLPLSVPSSAPVEQPPSGLAGNISRILQNVSRLSHCFHFLSTDETTNTRMDWIFDGTDPSGSSTHPLFSHPTFHRRFPSPTIFGDSRASSASCMKASRLPPIYRFLRARDRASRSRRHEGCVPKKGRESDNAYTFIHAKSEDLGDCYSASVTFKRAQYI